MSLKNLIKSLKPGSVIMPVLQDFVARENRLVREGKRSRKAAALKDAKLTIHCMKRRIEEFNHGDEIKGEFIHPSSIGCCLRALWFAHFDAPSEGRGKQDELRTYLIFESGTYFHVLMQNLLSRAKILVRREVAIQDKANRILGHCDAVVKVDDIKYAVELKTINSRQFTLLGNTPKMAHKQQLHCYMKSLGLDWGIILYYNKDTSDVKEFVIQFDQGFYEDYCNRRITKLFKAIQSRKLPDRECEGPGKPPCSYCEFANVCYSEHKTKTFVKRIQK